MDTRVSIIGIILEKKDEVEKLKSILHEYSKWIMVYIIILFSHPDFTVGFGISPNHATNVARGL